MSNASLSSLPIDVEQRERETALFNEAYAAYRATQDAKPLVLALAPYVKLDVGSNGPRAMVYNGLLQEHLSQLANDLNAVVNHYQQLTTWAEVVARYEDDIDRMLIVREFAECLAIYLLNFPYALVQRFAFSVSHLTHQANLVTRVGWNEAKLPSDERITPRTMREIAADWPSFPRFDAALKFINDDDFATSTDEYRSKQHHRIPARLELGLTQLVQRRREGTATSYGVGGKPALKIGDLLEPLALQYRHARAAFDAYVDLIKEQCDAVRVTLGTPPKAANS